MEIISEKAMVRAKTGEVVECKVVLAYVSGGKQIQYISDDGKVVNKEKLSRSPYRHQIAQGK